MPIIGIIESDQQIQTYFEEHDYPSDQQFANFIVSKYSKLEGIGEADTAASFIVPEDRLLLAIILKPTVQDQSIQVGLTSGGDELGAYVGSAGERMVCVPFVAGSGQDIYITSLNTFNYIKFVL